MRSKEGTHRFEVNPSDDFSILKDKVRIWPLEDLHQLLCLYTEPDFSVEQIVRELNINDPSTMAITDWPTPGMNPMDVLLGRSLEELNVKYASCALRGAVGHVTLMSMLT